jgi:phytoene synthase
MSRPPEAVDASSSYAACHRLARRAGSSFYPAFLLLPKAKRRAMEALYAFMRHSDDLADDDAPLDRRREALKEWRTAVRTALGGGRPEEGPGTVLLPALADAVRRFGIPPEHLEAVLDGVEMDLDHRGFDTFEDLAEYCRRVASAVGLACIFVWGFRGPEAFGPAGACGLAFQLTNILRDLREDAARGRIYLPRADLAECGFTSEELLRGVVNGAFERLIELESGRARALFHQGAGLFDWLEPAGRRIFGMMFTVYYRLLEEIVRRRRELPFRRVGVGRLRKIGIAARWLVLPPRRSSLP